MSLLPADTPPGIRSVSYDPECPLCPGPPKVFPMSHLAPLMNSTPTHESPPPLTPPRFGLGTLLFWVTVFCAWLASYSLLGPSGAFALGLLVLAIVAHVAGNAIGMRLRQHGGKRDPAVEREAAPFKGPEASRLGEHDFAPVTRLRQRDSLGKPIFYITALGSLACAILGGYGLARLLGENATVANVGVGVLASGVLGAIWSFIAGSFLQVAGTALWQASREK